MKRIFNIPAFIISFAVGIFLVYTLEPAKQQVWIYASPKNANEVQYKNNEQKCFKPKINTTSCSITAQNVNEPPSFMSNMSQYF